MYTALQNQAFAYPKNPHVFNELNECPWFYLNDEKVSYQFDGIAEFFGEDEEKYDGIGFSFQSNHYFQPGRLLQIGIPLPDSVHYFQAEVVTSEDKESFFQTGIYLRVESETDLLTLLRSSDYLNIRHTS